MLALLALVPLVPTTLFYIGHLNNGDAFINPELPTGWVLGYWTFLAVLAALEAWKLTRGRLTAGTTAASISVDVLLAVYLTVALITQQVLHPDLASEIGFSLGAWPVVLASG